MKIVAKAFALVCLALITASAALAQQAVEWRPSIAEDNKAATLDDTMRFVVKTANDATADQIFAPEEGYFMGAFRETFNAASSARCSLEWSDLLVRTDGIDRWRSVSDLTKVDALSIRVTPLEGVSKEQKGGDTNPDRGDLAKDAEGTTKGFLVTMSGTSGNDFSDYTGLYRFYWNKHLGHELSPDKRAFISEAESASCPSSNNKKCFVRQTREAHAYLFLADQEAAHRVARALMHAALLCGGVKAVRPF